MKKKLLSSFVIFLFSLSVFAQNYQLHTVYIYSFIRYIQWPTQTDTFSIGVLGDSPITDHLDKMAASKKAGARTIVIKKFNTSAEVTNTDVLFIAKNASSLLEELKELANGNNTLLVTEQDGLGMAGSAINFVERNGKLAFELNKSSIEDAGLKVSSELTRLAILL